MSKIAHPLVRYIDETLSYECIDDSEQVATRLQSLIAEETDQVALVTIVLHFEADEQEGPAYFEKKAGHSPAFPYRGTEGSIHHILETLRRRVRKTDIVYMYHSTCYFLLRGANLDGGHIVYNRLWDALLWSVHNMNDGEMPRPLRMSIGYAAYPHSYADVYECIEASHEGKQQFELQVERRSPTLPKKARHAHTSLYNDELVALSYNKQASSEECRVQDEQDLSLLARTLGIPYLSLLPRKKRAQVQRFVALELLRELRCYPLGREHGTLTVAVSDPRDNTIQDRLHRETGLRIFRVLTPPQELQTALDQLL